MKYFSMFSGIGGFELGIQQAHNSFNRYSTSKKKQKINTDLLRKNVCTNSKLLQRTPSCVGFSEIDKYAIQIYKKHFPKHKEYGDISKITWSDVEDFDLLVGGFPCQAFSIAGKRKGFDDTRGTLFFEVARCASEKQPRLLLLENVKGLLSHDKGKTFGVILNTLDELGYDLQWQVLNSKNFGVPQNRERVFIVGHLRGTSRPQVLPIKRKLQKNIKSKTSKLRLIQDKRQSKETRIWRNNSPCVSSYWGQGGGNIPYVNMIRRLTPTECERLQGFPDGWTEGVSDTQRYKCLGNAVTVNVVEEIGERLLGFNPCGGLIKRLEKS